MKNIIYIIYLLSLVGFSCTNGVPKSGSRKINMNDSSMIILEKDSQYLGNIVDDITPKANVSTKQEVSKIIQKVDSAKEANTLANSENNSVTGTNIECKEFKVTFGILMNQSGNHYIVPNFSTLNGVQIQVNGISEPSVQQRFFTRVKMVKGTESYVLDDLPEFANEWKNLAPNANLFLSANDEIIKYKNIDAKSILLAADRALRKAGKSRKELEALKKELANTNNYTDGPCSVYCTAIHYKISGKKNGKTVSETIKVGL
jgi:hypothetical protein